VKYACIARHKGELPVRLMCELLSVSPAGYYASLCRSPGARETANQRLRLEIRASHAESRQRYGAPKIHAALRRRGISCGHNRVARLMRVDGLRAKRCRAFRLTTQSQHQQPVAPNHLARRFSPTENVERDRAWAADITYLPTREGWLYLAAVLDLSSRRVVGWCADARLDQSLTLRALSMACTQRRPQNALHHSDQGVQYASGAYQAMLARHGMISSMSRRGNCWDNAVAESFFATLKTELVADAKWLTRQSAQRDLFEYIEVWYNRQRLHASLAYRTPAEYEVALLSEARAA
jgi:putative transposase